MIPVSPVRGTATDDAPWWLILILVGVMTLAVCKFIDIVVWLGEHVQII